MPGLLSGETLAEFIDTYLASATRLHHPAYMAHQVAVPHYAGALGALIDSFTNNAMAIYEMGPGAASIEYYLINWLLEKVGWQPAPLTFNQAEDQIFGGGVLTHGGSLKPQTNILCFRLKGGSDELQLTIRDKLTAQGHFYISTTARYFRAAKP